MLNQLLLVLFVISIASWQQSGAAASPTFKGVTFGKASTHCQPNNTSNTTSPDGGAFSILFDRLQTQTTTTYRGGKIRCDMSLKFLSPLETPTEILIDVRGADIKTEHAKTSATIWIDKLAYPIIFSNAESEDFSHLTLTLAKGVRRLNLSIVATTKAKYPESALIAIDSVDMAFASNK